MLVSKPNISTLDYNSSYKSISKVSHTVSKTKMELSNNKNNYTNLLIKQKYNSVNSGKPIVIAHRGASNAAPENSIPAIDEAAKRGYWGVELDVSSSSDGVLYLLHDGTLDRTTNGHGPITKENSHLVDKLIISNGANISSYQYLRLPKFEDALIECKKDNLIPVFDIKFLSNKDRDLNAFLKIVYRHGYENKLLVHSFNYRYLEYLRSKDKKIVLMPMVNPNRIMHGYRYIRSFGATGVDCDIKYLNKRLVWRAHKDGLKVFSWTIDTPTQLNKALQLGVDYIYSDTYYPGNIKYFRKVPSLNKYIKTTYRHNNHVINGKVNGQNYSE